VHTVLVEQPSNFLQLENINAKIDKSSIFFILLKLIFYLNIAETLVNISF